MAKKNNPGYQETFDSLQKLVNEIEQDQIPLDQLAEKVQQAKSLVDLCNQKLRGIELGVKKASGEDWPGE